MKIGNIDEMTASGNALAVWQFPFHKQKESPDAQLPSYHNRRPTPSPGLQTSPPRNGAAISAWSKFILTIFALVHYQEIAQAAQVRQLSLAQVERYVHLFLCYGVRGVAFKARQVVVRN